MLTYTAHRKPDLLDQANDGSDIVFIKDGFSWPGLLIPFFWMIWHRLWLPLAVYLAAVAPVGAGRPWWCSRCRMA